MKNYAPLRFCLFSLVIFLLASCRDEEIIFPLSTCPEGATYALDYRTTALDDGYIWFSESDGDVGHEERLNTSLAAGVLQAFNFPGACEETYTVSRAVIPFESGSSAEGVARSFRITEIGEVPSGALLDRVANSRTSEVIINSGQIEILGVPPIEQAQLLVQISSFSGQGLELVEEHRYFPNDSLLVLDINSLFSTSAVGRLLLRLSETQEVFGFRIDFRTGYPTVMNFNQFTPMESRTLNIDWPVFSANHLLTVNWVDDVRSQQQIFLGTNNGSSSITVELPIDAEGVFLVKANWRNVADFEVQYVYEQWPTELVLDPIVAGQIDAFNYPEINFDIELADIIMLRGSLNNPPQDQFCSRHFIGPARIGKHTLTLPDLSPAFVDLGGSLPNLYERVYTETGRFTLIHYPAMQGSFDWYLNNIYNQGFSSENWLETLEYERVTVEL
ncbi:MAG: hypothetical protein AAFN81_16035 [Bacteroidota bacterium]